jgi:hypothetical protein
MHKQCKGNVLEESRYIHWNQRVRENKVLIWQENCCGPPENVVAAQARLRVGPA